LNPLLTQLRESREFQVVMVEMVKSRPLVPRYTPQLTRDATENLIEQVKHQSSMQQGFDLLYQLLTGNKL